MRVELLNDANLGFSVLDTLPRAALACAWMLEHRHVLIGVLCRGFFLLPSFLPKADG
jgi:hypothetical protein